MVLNIRSLFSPKCHNAGLYMDRAILGTYFLCFNNSEMLIRAKSTPKIGFKNVLYFIWFSLFYYIRPFLYFSDSHFPVLRGSFPCVVIPGFPSGFVFTDLCLLTDLLNFCVCKRSVFVPKALLNGYLSLINNENKEILLYLIICAKRRIDQTSCIKQSYPPILQPRESKQRLKKVTPKCGALRVKTTRSVFHISLVV